MIIAERFAWAHLPKTGGDATHTMFAAVPGLILFADDPHSNDKHLPFFAREREVATLLRRRYSTDRIAEELGISAVTVRRHVSKLQQKLGVASRPAAIALLDD